YEPDGTKQPGPRPLHAAGFQEEPERNEERGRVPACPNQALCNGARTCDLSAWYYSGVLATVTTTAIHCGQQICLYADHPRRSGVSRVGWFVGAVVLLMVLVWLPPRGNAGV